MFKGVITGGAWGVIVAGVGLSVASLLGEPPAGNAPPAPPLVEAPVAGSGAAEGAAPPVDPSVMSQAPTMEAAPQVDAPAPEGAPPMADIAPAPTPQTGTVDSILTEPQIGTAPQVAADPEQPVLPNPQSVAPQVPAREEDLAVSVDPAAPPPGAPTEEFVAVAPVVPAAPAASADVAPQAMSDVATPEQPGIAPAPTALPEAETEAAPDVPAEVAVAVPSPDAVLTVQPETAPVAVTPDVTVAQADPAATVQPVTPEGATDVAPGTAEPGPMPTPVPADGASDVVTLAPLPETPANPAPAVVRPQVGLSGPVAGSMPTGTSTVKVLRPDNAPAEPPVAEAESVAVDAPALERFATPYDTSAGLPLMAVVLVDDGALPSEAEALAAIPFPISVAIDPALPDAEARAEGYRAAGLEVVAMPRLPEGAALSDVEVTYEAAFAAVPDAVAVLDAGSGGLQSNRNVTDQAMAKLKADGRGLLTESRGLNMAERAAETAGVPAVSIYRNLDSEGQDARVIRRFLDQAAFRARQQTGVVLLGRIRPDTISALILWGTAQRSGQVGLAPVSAVLKAATP